MAASLELTRIVSALGIQARRFDIDLLDQCESTNAVLLQRAEAGAPAGSVVVTSEQSAGRGRRGRTWLSAPGDSMTFSLLWRFAPGTAPAGLSLAVGLAVARAIESCSPVGVQLKWPNDLLLQNKKLGGILIELVPGAPHAAVIGIGLNLQLPVGMPDALRAQSAALGEKVDPHALLAALLAELLTVLELFGQEGFPALRTEWGTRDVFANVPVCLFSDFAPPRDGICRGADNDGALLFEADGRIERVLSGEVSLRGQA